MGDERFRDGRVLRVAAALALLAGCGLRKAWSPAPPEGDDLALLGPAVRVEDPLLVRRRSSLELAGSGERALVVTIEARDALRVSCHIERLRAPLSFLLEPRGFPAERRADSVELEVGPGELTLSSRSRRELRPRARVACAAGAVTGELDIEVADGRARARFGPASLELAGAAFAPETELVLSVRGEGSDWGHEAQVLVTALHASGAAPRGAGSVAAEALARANALLALGQASDAAAVYSDALAGETLRRARAGRSLALLEADHPAEAALDLAAASALDPRLGPALDRALDRLLGAGELALAADAALEAARFAPEDLAVAARFQRIATRVRSRAEKEGDAVRRARALAALRDLDDIAHAEEALEKAAPGVEVHLARAEALSHEALLLAARKEEGAAAAFDRAIIELERGRALAPQDERVFRGLGTTYLLAHQPHPAVLMLRRATQIDAASADAWYFLGRALLDDGDAVAAIPCFDHACALRPTAADAHLERARARERTEDLGGAREDLDAATALGLGRDRELTAMRARLAR
jgi:tetratricopeptide (TPR) repeat protein